LPEAATHITGASPSSLPAPDDLPSTTTPILESSGAALDTSAINKIRELMNRSLQLTDLRAWIDSHNTSTSAKNKRGMSFTPISTHTNGFLHTIDLIQFIIDTAAVPIPSVEEIHAIVLLVSNSSTFALCNFIHTYSAKV